MSVLAAGYLAAALGLYAAAGLLFALPFLACRLHRIDSATRGAGFAFRLILLPATVALWPVLLRQWLRSAR